MSVNLESEALEEKQIILKGYCPLSMGFCGSQIMGLEIFYNGNVYNYCSSSNGCPDIVQKLPSFKYQQQNQL